MKLYHSVDSINKIKHLVDLVENRCEDIIYTTDYPQNDYGHYVLSFEAIISDDSYDQGGISWSNNIAVLASNILLDTMQVHN